MSLEELNKKRASIDHIDAEIIALLNKRLDLANAIGTIKEKSGAEI